MNGAFKAKKTVLVIDDQYAIRLLMREILHKEEISVLQAGDGEQALLLFEKHHPDLVLLDMKMPGMDGLEILRRIRMFSLSVKVIIMTAYGELDLISKTGSLGVIMHFAKPFDIQALKCAILRHLTTCISSRCMPC